MFPRKFLNYRTDVKNTIHDETSVSLYRLSQIFRKIVNLIIGNVISFIFQIHRVNRCLLQFALKYSVE